MQRRSRNTRILHIQNNNIKKCLDDNDYTYTIATDTKPGNIFFAGMQYFHFEEKLLSGLYYDLFTHKWDMGANERILPGEKMCIFMDFDVSKTFTPPNDYIPIFTFLITAFLRKLEPLIKETFSAYQGDIPVEFGLASRSSVHLHIYTNIVVIMGQKEHIDACDVIYNLWKNVKQSSEYNSLFPSDANFDLDIQATKRGTLRLPYQRKATQRQLPATENSYWPIQNPEITDGSFWKPWLKQIRWMDMCDPEEQYIHITSTSSATTIVDLTQNEGSNFVDDFLLSVETQKTGINAHRMSYFSLHDDFRWTTPVAFLDDLVHEIKQCRSYADKDYIYNIVVKLFNKYITYLGNTAKATILIKTFNLRTNENDHLLLTMADARSFFSNLKFPMVSSNESGSKRRQVMISLFDVWVDSVHRNVTSLIFAPNKPLCGEENGSRYCNTWEGLKYSDCIDQWQNSSVHTRFGVKIICNHLLKVVCDESEEQLWYLLQWLRNLLVSPEKKLHTMLLFQGIEGCGKSIFWKNFIKAFGKHAKELPTFTKMMQSGFNQELCKPPLILGVIDDGDFLHANSSIQGNGINDMVKNLVTSDKLACTLKYQETIVYQNYLNLVVLTNVMEDYKILRDRYSRRMRLFKCKEINSENSIQFKQHLPQLIRSMEDINVMCAFMGMLMSSEFFETTRVYFTENGSYMPNRMSDIIKSCNVEKLPRVVSFWYKCVLARKNCDLYSHPFIYSNGITTAIQDEWFQYLETRNPQYLNCLVPVDKARRIKVNCNTNRVLQPIGMVVSSTAMQLIQTDFATWVNNNYWTSIVPKDVVYAQFLEYVKTTNTRGRPISAITFWRQTFGLFNVTDPAFKNTGLLLSESQLASKKFGKHHDIRHQDFIYTYNDYLRKDHAKKSQTKDIRSHVKQWFAVLPTRDECLSHLNHKYNMEGFNVIPEEYESPEWCLAWCRQLFTALELGPVEAINTNYV
jgi:hypothetical protein